ncbi:hypothetical protein L218DRAFT_76369 [Marasmius fiardii PR-910]|nr:hypothetical protein L218DRAFT_76369 [Marasmius fiardii PR-910]
MIKPRRAASFFCLLFFAGYLNSGASQKLILPKWNPEHNQRWGRPCKGTKKPTGGIHWVLTRTSHSTLMCWVHGSTASSHYLANRTHPLHRPLPTNHLSLRSSSAHLTAVPVSHFFVHNPGEGMRRFHI